MPNDPNPKDAGAAAQNDEEPRYDVEELVEQRFRRLGPDVSQHAIRGALSEQRRKTFTAAEAKKIVAAWEKREVPSA